LEIKKYNGVASTINVARSRFGQILLTKGQCKRSFHATWDDDDDDRQPTASTSLVSEVPEPDALELLAGLSQFELRAANLEANAIYVRGGISLLY